MFKNLRPGTRKAQVWLFVSVVLLIVQIVAFGFSQAALYRFYSSNTGNVSDNQTWVVSQLEVDYQKLRASLLQAGLEVENPDLQKIPSDNWSDVILAFDIYYSRVDTVANQVTLLEAKGDVPADYNSYISVIKANRAEVSHVLDSVEVPDKSTTQRTLALLSEVEVPIRELAVDTLYVLSQRADFERRSARNYLHFHITVSVLTIALLVAVSATILVMLKDSRIQYSRLQKVLSAQDQLIRQIPRAFLLTDKNGTILRSNKVVEKLLGWSETEALGRKIWKIFPQKRRKYWKAEHQACVQIDLEPGQSTTVRDIAVDKYGNRFPAEILVMHLQDAGKSAYLLIVRSIALEQRAMRALRRDRTAAHKMAARNSRVLSVMSHEMRTPLHGVIGALDLAKQQNLTSEGEKLIDVALESSKAALSYADDAMKLVGIELNPQIAEKTQFSPRDVIREVVEMLRPAAAHQGNKVLTELGSDVDITILGQAELLRHSVSNLLSNAIKFTKNGTITVKLLAGAEPNTLRVEVIDTGIGISPEQQGMIFSDYMTESDQVSSSWHGSGLGLGLFKRAVSVMRGQFGVESAPGKGSLFWFTLPIQLAEAEESPAEKAETPEEIALPKALKLLVVDDNNLNLNLISKMLDTLGLSYELASGGKEALEKASRTFFDVILLDIGMPELDGYAVAREIRRQSSSQNAHIIAFTADSSVDRNGDFLKSSGIDDLLLKPVTTQALHMKLIQFYTEHIKSDPSPPPRHALTSTEILDKEVIDDLIALDGPTGLAPLIEALMDQAMATLRSLETSSNKDLPDLSPQLHDLAGAAAMMGATRLAEIARECEIVFNQGDTPTHHLKQNLRDSVERTKTEFAMLQTRVGGSEPLNNSQQERSEIVPAKRHAASKP
jgi:PAS domain S-box-containing protein